MKMIHFLKSYQNITSVLTVVMEEKNSNSKLDFSPGFDKAVFKVSKELSGFSIRDDDIELIEQIGTGSSGSVYRSKYMGSTAAVKRCLIVDLLEDPLKGIFYLFQFFRFHE
jgi:hypothetical protein